MDIGGTIQKEVMDQKCSNCGHDRMKHYWAVDERIYCRDLVKDCNREEHSCGCRKLKI